MGGAKATQCQFDRGLRWMTYDTIICVDTDDPDTMAPKTELHRHPVDLVFGGAQQIGAVCEREQERHWERSGEGAEHS